MYEFFNRLLKYHNTLQWEKHVDQDLEDEKQLRGCAASESLFINVFNY